MATDKTYEGKVVRLCELAGDEGVIRGFVFIDCDVRGPAIIYPRNSTFVQVAFGGPADAMLWEISVDRTHVIGAILVDDCTFERCRFTSVGFTGNPDFIALMRSEVAP